MVQRKSDPIFMVLKSPLHKLEVFMGNLLPGGYTFTHLVFWTVVGMVGLGTNAVAIILVIGLVMMLLESVQRS